MLAVVVSRADEASEHIGEHLLEIAEWEQLTDDSLPEADVGTPVAFSNNMELD